MGTETRGSRQGEHPNDPQAPNTTQPDQEAVAKRERLLTYNKAYYLKRREQARERNRKYVHQHRKLLNAKRRTGYQKNPTPMRAATRQWVAKNRERRRASQKAWYQEQRERILVKRRAYYHNKRRLLLQDGISEQISCKKPMVSPKPPRSVFLDSSVLYAMAFSSTGPARRLLLKGFAGHITLCISDLVLEETKRNLTKNAPLALPAFSIIADLLSAQTTRPTKAEVLRAAKIVHLKDAAIVAAAARVKADYLATHDVKHLLVPD
jgi:predicted nucleic acid-binding protein